MSKRILPGIIFLFSLSIFFCNNEHTGSFPNSTIERLYKIGECATQFTDVFVPVDTISFEFTEKSILGSISQICGLPNGYLVLDNFYSDEVFLFERDGKFIQTVARKGEGPNEYKNPDYIAVDDFGNCFILDSSLRKIIHFSSSTKILTDLSFKQHGIDPSSFIVVNDSDKTKIIFLDFRSGKNNNRVFVFELQNDKLIFQNSIGSIDDTSLRLPFPNNCLGMSSTGYLWIGKSFDLGIQIYSIRGEMKKVLHDHIKQLPGPHIKTEYFDGFNRLSQSLDTFYKYTRLSQLYFFQDFVLGYYIGPNQRKDNLYFIFFQNDGYVLNILLEDTENTVLPGNDGHYIYRYLSLDDSIEASNQNPKIIRYRVK